MELNLKKKAALNPCPPTSEKSILTKQKEQTKPKLNLLFYHKISFGLKTRVTAYLTKVKYFCIGNRVSSNVNMKKYVPAGKSSPLYVPYQSF